MLVLHKSQCMIYILLEVKSELGSTKACMCNKRGVSKFLFKRWPNQSLLIQRRVLYKILFYFIAWLFRNDYKSELCIFHLIRYIKILTK